MASPDGVLNLKLPLPAQLLFLHVAAWGLALVLAMLLKGMGVTLPGLAPLVALQGVLAWGLTHWLGLPVWWRWISLVFFPAIELASQFALSPAWYLAGLLLLLLVQFGALTTRVPLYLSGREARAEIARHLASSPQARFLDLGSGTGTLLAYLSRHCPNPLHGVEAAPLNWLLSRLRLGRRAHIRLGDLWSEDLSQYDIVYAFLSPAPMARLWQKARQEMRPGTVFISNSFAVPGVEPDETVMLNDAHDARLLIWRIR